MPDDEVNKVEEQEGEEIKEADVGSKDGSFLGALLKFIITSTIAIGCAFAFVWVVLSSPGEEPTEVTQRAEELAPDEGTIAQLDERSTVKLEDIIVNVEGTEGRRYLKTTLYLEVDEGLKRQIEGNKVLMMDALISLLSTKTLADLEGIDNQNRARREIRDELNLVLGKKDAIKRVYLYDFVVQ